MGEPRRGKPPIQYDWKAIEELYLDGVAPSDLASRFGCSLSSISRMATNGGWFEKRAAVIYDRTKKRTNPDTMMPEEVSKNVRQWFVADVLRVTEALEVINPKTLDIKELAQRQAIVNDCLKMADSLFNWSKEPEKKRIRTDIIVEMVRKLEEQANGGKVIDAQPVTDGQSEAALPNGHCANIAPEGEACFSEDQIKEEDPGTPL